MKTDPAAHPLVQYILQPADPKGHLFDVTLDVTGLADEPQCVSLPAWIPGSYMIRDFARNIGREVRLVQHEVNRGKSASLRTGMTAATGDLIAMTLVLAARKRGTGLASVLKPVLPLVSEPAGVMLGGLGLAALAPNSHQRRFGGGALSSSCRS